MSSKLTIVENHAFFGSSNWKRKEEEKMCITWQLRRHHAKRIIAYRQSNEARRRHRDRDNNGPDRTYELIVASTVLLYIYRAPTISIYIYTNTYSTVDTAWSHTAATSTLTLSYTKQFNSMLLLSRTFMCIEADWLLIASIRISFQMQTNEKGERHKKNWWLLLFVRRSKVLNLSSNTQRWIGLSGEWMQEKENKKKKKTWNTHRLSSYNWNNL